MVQVAQRTEELQLATQDLELLTRENQAIHTDLAACHHQVRGVGSVGKLYGYLGLRFGCLH